MPLLKQLNELTQTPGAAGFEGDIASVIMEMWRPLVDTVTTDRLGNVVAMKRGSGSEPRRRLMLSAHMDEIALLVSSIETFNGYGFLRVQPLGGVDRRQVIGQRVTVHAKHVYVGVVGALPATMRPDENMGAAYDYEEFVVDVGLSAETVKANIAIGDCITFNQPVHELMGGRIATKSVDNRACVAALTVALDYLQSRSHSWDVVVVATIQEETRLLGGYTAAFSQKPDAAIALDVVFATQPGTGSSDAHPLGSGPVLDVGVNVHPGMYAQLKKSADTLEMKTTVLTHTRASGTETAAIQLTEAGIPTGLISIPIRNMHTMVETVVLKDIKRAGRLVGEFAAQLDDAFLSMLQAALFD